MCRICILAGDISPIDVITHIPILCEDNDIPYIYVPSKEVCVCGCCGCIWVVWEDVMAAPPYACQPTVICTHTTGTGSGRTDKAPHQLHAGVAKAHQRHCHRRRGGKGVCGAV